MKAPWTNNARNALPLVAQEGPALEEYSQVAVEMPTNLSRLLTTRQAAEVLAVSVGTVKNLMCDGKLAYVKIGRATRVDLADINQYIVRHRRKQRRGLHGVTGRGEPGEAARP